MKLSVFSFVILLSLCLHHVSAEKEMLFSTSIMKMEILLKMERTLIENVNQYAANLNSSLTSIKVTLDDIRNVTKKRTPAAVLFENVFLKVDFLLRWMHLLNCVEKPIGRDFLNAINETLKSKPNLNDVKAAAQAIQRLQIVYDLNIDSMAQGWLNKRKFRASLSALDANTIGKLLFEAGSRENARNWLEASLRIQFDKERYKRVFGVSIKKFYYDYKYAAMKVDAGNYKNLSDIQATKRGIYNELKFTSTNDAAIADLQLELATIEEDVGTVLKVYKRICRGRPLIDKVRNLKCYYNSGNIYLLLQPTKVEILNFEPPMFLLHDIISDGKIAAIKNASSSNCLGPTSIYNDNGVMVASAEIRTAQKCDYFDILDWNSWHRIEWTMGIIAMRGVEEPNIVNYGIGGHYSFHLDLLPDYEAFYGNRLASIIIYLSDVELGGATVFPFHDIAVFPQKGAALLWFNMDKDGNKDYSLLHSACPVLKGSKWIISQWHHRLDLLHNTYENFLQKRMLKIP